MGAVRRDLKEKNQVRDSRTSELAGKRRGKDGKNYPDTKQPRVKKAGTPPPSTSAPAEIETGPSDTPLDANQRQEEADEKRQTCSEGSDPEMITAGEDPAESNGPKSITEPVPAATPAPLAEDGPMEESAAVQNVQPPHDVLVIEGTTTDGEAVAVAVPPNWHHDIIAQERVEERLACAAEVTPSDRYDEVGRELFRVYFKEMTGAINRAAGTVCLAPSVRQKIAAETAVALATFIRSGPTLCP